MNAPQTPAQPAEALEYVLSNVDEARGYLDRAMAALATATAYGRIALANDHDNHKETP